MRKVFIKCLSNGVDLERFRRKQLFFVVSIFIVKNIKYGIENCKYVNHVKERDNSFLRVFCV